MKCQICDHPNVHEINSLLRNDSNVRAVARTYDVPYSALYRHYKKNHHVEILPAGSNVPALESSISSAEDIVREFEQWHSEAKRMYFIAERNGDLKTALLGLDKALKCLELIGKMQGQIQDVQINLSQINIFNSPMWEQVGDVIMCVLADYPDLRTKIAEELIAMEESAKK